VADVGKTYKRAKDLDSDIQNMLKKIQGRGKHKFSGSPTVPSVVVESLFFVN